MNFAWRSGMAVLVVVAASWPSPARAESARQILEATGVTGGLAVHLGCGDGELTAALAVDDNMLVHGLDADPQNVAAARRLVMAAGKYGQVSIEVLDGDRLPYADDLVNLIVADVPGEVSIGEMTRVLCPGGVAYVKQTGGGEYKTIVKPWPATIDQWTHYLHGPDNNAVGHDSVVGLPQRLQWMGGPKFARAHEQTATMSACVTAGGRMFYIIDEAPCADVRFPSDWYLVARDAFNGVVLWKRPMGTWVDQLRRFRSGPADTAFRLVAQDGRVYATLAFDAPVSILDAATGRTLAECEQSQNARQVLRIGGQLIMLIDTASQMTAEHEAQVRRGLQPAPGKRAILAADARTGKTVWRKEIDGFLHPTLAAQGGRLFYQTRTGLFCADLKTGKQLWTQPTDLKLSAHEAGWESPTLVVHDKNVYCADFKKIIAYAVEDGRQLWTAPSRAGYNSPPDVFVVDGLVWLMADRMRGLDPATGEVKRQLPMIRGYMHHRCYRNKATDRFFLLGHQGVQLVDLESGDVWPNHWIRGTCQYGIMPANGLIYVSPDSCACNMKTKLAGFWALAAKQQTPQPKRPAPRLVLGPAQGKIDPVAAADGDWPVHRHDFARSGITTAQVPAEIKPAWQADVGGRLSGMTVAGGKLLVASIDTHTVYALDQASGEPLWSFTANGRVDSPPTFHNGMVLFGSADGWVYALRAADGQLAWRFRAAPLVRRTFVNGQLESVWPVHGSVLIDGDELVVAAGRSSYIDGGIRVYRLDPATGKMLSQTVLFSPDPETGKQPKPEPVKDVRGVLSDILLAEDGNVFMRHVKLDFDTGSETGQAVHLFSPIGLLDDTWWHRGYWVISDEFIPHWSGWWKTGNAVPSGRILSYDGQSVFGYGRDKYVSGNTGQWRGGEHYRLFACDRPAPERVRAQPVTAPAAGRSGRRGKPAAGQRSALKRPTAAPDRWSVRVPMYVRAMLLADQTLFIAGPPDLAQPEGLGEQALHLETPDQAQAAWEGKAGGLLWAVSATDAKRLAQYKLDAPPVFDGLAATPGRLFMATVDGKVICWKAGE